MTVKVLGDAPAMAMGNLFWSWAKYGGDVRTQESVEDLYQNLLDLPKDGSPNTHGREDMFAAAPTESLDWSDSGKGDEKPGQGGGHRGSSHGGDGGDDVTMALSLFKAFGHGDFDL